MLLQHTSMGQFIPKSKTHIFPLACSAIYPCIYFWYELHSFGDIDCCDVFLLSSMMGLSGDRLVVLKTQKNTFEKIKTSVSFRLPGSCNPLVLC